VEDVRVTTRQVVSICNIHGGMALDAEEASNLADLLVWAARNLDQAPDTALHIRGRFRLRRLIQVLRGEALTEDLP
jgi:hypothetical protein